MDWRSFSILIDAFVISLCPMLAVFMRRCRLNWRPGLSSPPVRLARVRIVRNRTMRPKSERYVIGIKTRRLRSVNRRRSPWDRSST